MPVRKVVTRSGKRFRGKFPSRKLARMVQWESLFERDAFKLVEYDPRVASYEEQPSEETYYEDDGRPRTYFPDLRIFWVDDRQTDVEIKPLTKIQKPEIERKFALIAKRYAEQRRSFEIWTEREIRENQRSKNVEVLHRARKRPCSPALAEQLLLDFDPPRMRLKQAAALLGGERSVLELIAMDKLRCDLEAALNDEAFVWLASFEQGGRK